METNKKRLIKKGRMQGFIVTFVIMLIIFLIAGAAAVFALMGTGSLNYGAFYGKPSDSIIDDQAADKIETLQSIIEKYYLNDYSTEDMRDGLYKGLLESLGDPYSVYYTEKEYSEMTEDSEGVFEGIGAYLTQDPDTMVVTV